MTKGLDARGKYGLVVSTTAGALPVTLAKAKQQLSVSTTDDDALITDLITWATARFEADTGRVLVNTVYDWYLDGFPDDGVLELPRSPCLGSSTVTITYVNTSGTTATWSSSLYDVDARAEPGRVYPAYNQTYPADVRSGVVNTVKVRFTAGYGTSQATVPPLASAAIRMAVAEQYRHREVGGWDQMADEGWRNAIGLMKWEL